MTLAPTVAAPMLACVRDPVSPEAEGAVHDVVARGHLDYLLEAARSHRVLPFVARTLAQVPDAPQEAKMELERRAAGLAAHQLRIMDDLAWLGSALDQIDVPWIAFKGPVVATTLYEDLGLRPFRDLDILLPRDRFAEALGHLERLGAYVLDRNWTLILREQRGQLHLTLRLQTVADVHWHLLNRGSVRASFAVPTEDLFARARTVDLNGLQVRTLDPVDTTIHLALHAALAGGDRLCWLKDVERATVVDPPQWDVLVDRAHAWKAGPPTAVVLSRAAALLGATVPEGSLAELEPSRARRAIGGWVDRRDPVHMAVSTTSASTWSQVVRDGGWATTGALIARLLRPFANAVHRLRGEPVPHRDRGSGAVLVPSGPHGAKESYMRWLSTRPSG